MLPKIKVINSNIVTALDAKTIGSKVTHPKEFFECLVRAIESYDFTKAQYPGQGYLLMNDAVPFVSAGVGLHSSNPDDYVIRKHRDRVGTFLKRSLAAQVTTCACVVYTLEAYLADPDITAEEASKISLDATHVLVAVLASAGAPSPLSPYRLVWNLAGGNNEALTWSAEMIRQKAKEAIDYDSDWCTVAD